MGQEAKHQKVIRRQFIGENECADTHDYRIIDQQSQSAHARSLCSVARSLTLTLYEEYWQQAARPAI
jgi:hypothetical protein